jgi:ubiquinone/menaquinone biosynthesis C-methylase UbiE
MPAVRENRNPRLKFIAGDCFQLPFQSSSFNVVFGSLVLCQLPDLDEIFREIRRVLADGGYYVGIEPNPYHAVHLYRYLRGYPSPNLYLLGPKHLAAFKNAGFEFTIRYFYAKLPRMRNQFLGTCMGIVGKPKR